MWGFKLCWLLNKGGGLGISRLGECVRLFERNLHRLNVLMYRERDAWDS